MDTIHKLVVQLVFVLITVNEAQSDATVQIKMTHYWVDGRDWENSKCDTFWTGNEACDPKFEFCIDSYNGNDVMTQCAFGHFGPTHDYHGTNHVIFTDQFNGGLGNPLVATIKTYNGFKFKTEVYDEDTGNGDDKIDYLHVLHNSQPARTQTEAVWKNNIRVDGTRQHGNSYLLFNLLLYCNPNFYGPQCAVHCVGKDDDVAGHYKCDPDTGEKICRTGWETVDENCLVKINDCEHHLCQNGATCVDHYKSYSCNCAPGYTGRYCDLNINECDSSPCINGGTCTDHINEFSCACTQHYSGLTCVHHECDTNPNYCHNGGTCINDNDIPSCLCPQQYTGVKCDVNTCDVIECRNGGTCNNGMCDCPVNYIGLLCDTDLCQHITCLNGGTCVGGKCTCPPGYTGIYCHENIDECISNPCQNDGVCDDKVLGYICRCQPGYRGNHCQTLITTTTMKTTTTTTSSSTTLPTTTTTLTSVISTTTTPTTTTPTTSTPTTTTFPSTISSTMTTKLTGPGINDSQGQQRNTVSSVSQGIPMWVYILIAVAVVLIIVVLIAIYFSRKRRKAEAHAPPVVITDSDCMSSFTNPLYSDPPSGLVAGATAEKNGVPGYYDAQPPPYTPHASSISEEPIYDSVGPVHKPPINSGNMVEVGFIAESNPPAAVTEESCYDNVRPVVKPFQTDTPDRPYDNLPQRSQYTNNTCQKPEDKTVEKQVETESHNKGIFAVNKAFVDDNNTLVLK